MAFCNENMALLPTSQYYPHVHTHTHVYTSCCSAASKQTNSATTYFGEKKAINRDLVSSQWAIKIYFFYSHTNRRVCGVVSYDYHIQARTGKTKGMDNVLCVHVCVCVHVDLDCFVVVVVFVVVYNLGV